MRKGLVMALRLVMLLRGVYAGSTMFFLGLLDPAWAAR